VRFTEAATEDASDNSDSDMSSKTVCEATGARADGDIIANRNRSEHLSAGSNVDAVPNGWRRVGSGLRLFPLETAVDQLHRKRVVWAVLMGGCQSYVST
jgi:hypothetical protein